MLLVLCSLRRSGIPGVPEWSVANILGIAAFVLYAYGRSLPPLIAFEVANGAYALASAALLVGFRRYFTKNSHIGALGIAVLLSVVLVAIFHYRYDSYALRTATVAAFQATVGIAIGLTVFNERKTRRFHYPHFFVQAMALIVAVGHGMRSVIHLTMATGTTSLLQESAWNLFFLSAGTLVLPVLTLGAVMMVHDRMIADAEDAANRDFLTGSWSRRAFFELAERELRLARRTGRKLSLLIVDVDHFKTINDTYGHAVGDQVLVDIAVRADAIVRDVDYFARIGGEEFAALLPEADGKAALKIGERLRGALEQTAQENSSQNVPGPFPAYTVSIGVATLGPSESFRQLMHRADSALYRAKGSGRNSVVCAEDPAQS